jgi:RNA polymerase sigma-70 factor (ECF subfamily)
MSTAPGAKDTETAKQDMLAGLYEEYYDRIARYAYTRTGDRAAAEDLAGEVFLKALESLKSYQERGVPMQAWLFRIAHNLVVDHLRKRSKSQNVPIDTVQIESGANPATVAEENIEMERVTKAMEQLTREQREVIGLRFFGGLSSKEVGSIMNKKDGAVREMQRAAIEKLRHLLVIPESNP